MIEDHELEMFKKYGLDSEKVRFFRDVLNDVPPAPLEELHEQRRQLASMLDRMNALQNEARQLCGEVDDRMYCHWDRALYYAVYRDVKGRVVVVPERLKEPD